MSSGELALDIDAHKGALWALAVRADGKGLMTGAADKYVRFWDFTVSQ